MVMCNVSKSICPRMHSKRADGNIYYWDNNMFCIQFILLTIVLQIFQNISYCYIVVLLSLMLVFCQKKFDVFDQVKGLSRLKVLFSQEAFLQNHQYWMLNFVYFKKKFICCKYNIIDLNKITNDHRIEVYFLQQFGHHFKHLFSRGLCFAFLNGFSCTQSMIVCQNSLTMSFKENNFILGKINLTAKNGYNLSL